MIEPLAPGLVAALACGEAHPTDADAPSGVTHLQTHLSHVFLTRTRVYKLRKAVDLGFVCFATRRERNDDCVREVLLNRRLAPDVYLGVAPVLSGAGGFQVGAMQIDPRAPLPDLEHCVVMRRLPAGRDALSLLERGAFTPAQLDRVAVRVAAFHAAHGLGEPAPFSETAWRGRIAAPVEANFESLGLGGVPADLVRETRDAARRFLDEESGRFEARRRAGRAVDAHGDLHLQHVFFETDDAEPILIDCLEFSDDLRRIDVASEVAFLAMDLRYRGEPGLAERFLRVYARESDDFDLYRVVDFFLSYRAAVRAKVAAIAAGEPEIGADQRGRAAESARRHLVLAREALRRPAPGPLVVVRGAVGTGKSTAAAEIADVLGGAVVASDRVRKHLAGLAPTERVRGADLDALYAEGMTAQVYAALLERARPILESGRAAVLDATWARAHHLEQALGLARDAGTPAILVETRCARAVTLARLAARAAAATDPSDAGPERYDASVAALEPAPGWPESRKITVDTEPGDWKRNLAARVRAVFP